MQPRLLPNGRVQLQSPSGELYDIGPDHADYQRLIGQSLQPPKLTMARLFGLLGIAIGVGAWWFNWHLAATEGHFYVKLILLGPLGVFGGLLMLVRPEWAGPLRADSTTSHKAALCSVIALMLAGSGLEFYRLQAGEPRQPTPPLSRVPRSEWSPKLSNTFDSNFLFQGKMYHLDSFNQKVSATWEFAAPGETVHNWTTLLTLVDRPDAHTRADLDGVSEGVMANYKSHGGQILLAKTMQDATGTPYNYIVAAFEDAATHRYELNFVKIALGAKNGTIAVYGVRMADQAKAKQFLTQESDRIGRAVASAGLPDLNTLPRREF